MKCLNCGKETKNPKFCNKSCSATYNNKLRTPERFCKNCNKKLVEWHKKLFCNRKCYGEFKHKITVENYKKGIVKHHPNFRKWLIKERGAKCEKCGWSEINPYSQTIPIVLNHIDGNSNNWSFDNLELLCPNCDSLTSTYKNLNKGNGRYKRMERYKEGKSY